MHAMRNRALRNATAVLVALGLVTTFVAVEHATKAGSTSPLPAVKDYVALVNPNLSGYQRAVLADNTVTFVEHEEAKQRTVQCGEAAGLRMGLEPAVGLRPGRYSITAATEAEMEDAIEKLKTCEHEYMTEIESVWSLARAHYSGAELDRALDQLTACLHQKGVELPQAGLNTMDDVSAIVRVPWDISDPEAMKAALEKEAQYHLCSRDIEQKTGFYLP